LLFFVCILLLYNLVICNYCCCRVDELRSSLARKKTNIKPKTILQLQRGEEGNGGDKIWRKQPKTYICHNLYTYYYYTDGCKIYDGFINTYIIYYTILLLCFNVLFYTCVTAAETGCNFKKRKKSVLYVAQCVTKIPTTLFWSIYKPTHIIKWFIISEYMHSILYRYAVYVRDEKKIFTKINFFWSAYTADCEMYIVCRMVHYMYRIRSEQQNVTKNVTT